jgi:hypothetical protein
MSIKDIYSIYCIDRFQIKEWLLKKHYAKRLPSISWAFGLYRAGELVGVLSIGKPASPFLCKGVCGIEYADYVYELNRLCVNEGLEKNVLSFFVGGCLKRLKKDTILISYADKAMNHTGYIYQATNWIYTGKTKERTDIGTDGLKHSRHYDKSIDRKANRVFRSSKHRYVYFTGKRKAEFKTKLKYETISYPKEKNERYIADYSPVIQGVLF